MTFKTDMINSFTTARLIQWTNAGSNTGSTTIDDTVLANFESMVKSAFLVHAGVEYDETLVLHLQPAMRYGGVMLRVYAGDLDSFSAEEAQALDDVKAVRRVTHSDTIFPDKKLANVLPDSNQNRSAFSSTKLSRSGFPSIGASSSVDFFDERNT